MNARKKTAFILQVHNNQDQLNRFIQQLTADDQADVYVHVDAKSPPDFKGKIVQTPDVKVLDQSVNCIWGDFSQVETTLLLLREVLSSGRDYDYVCLRSGQDLLVREGFKEFLEGSGDKIYMSLREVSKSNLGLMHMNWPKMTRERYGPFHPIRMFRRLMQSLYRVGINFFPNKNPFPQEYTFHVGSQWFTIPMEVAKYTIDFVDENEWYGNYFKETMCPDEWFFQTLLMNSPYVGDIVNDNLMFLKWGEKFGERNSPTFLTMGDVEAIESASRPGNTGNAQGSGNVGVPARDRSAESTNIFFARKFNGNVDHSVVKYFSEKVKLSRSSSDDLDDTRVVDLQEV